MNKLRTLLANLKHLMTTSLAEAHDDTRVELGHLHGRLADLEDGIDNRAKDIDKRVRVLQADLGARIAEAVKSAGRLHR